MPKISRTLLLGVLWLSLTLESRGAVTIIARSGQHAPGAPAGVNVSSFEFFFNSTAGPFAFTASLAGPGVSFGVHDKGIFRFADGGISLAALTGEPAPNLVGSWNYRTLQLGSHDGQRIGFAAELASPTNPAVTSEAAFFGAVGAITSARQKGQLVPSLSDGALPA